MILFSKTKEIFVSVLILIIAVGFGIFIISQPFSLSQFQNNKISFENYDPNFKKIDTDNDGLSDDEEKLIGTNPEIADTDADSFLDGEEITSGHNPLIKSPGDELKNNPLPGQNLINKNYTKEISTNLFGEILKSYINNRNLANNQETAQQNIENQLNASISEFLSGLTNPQSAQQTETGLLDETQTRKLLVDKAINENESVLNDKISEMENEIISLANFNLNEKGLNIIQNANSEQINAYKTEIKNIILEGMALEMKSYRLIKNTSSFSQDEINGLASELNNYVYKIKSATIPEQFKKFHIAFLEYALKQKFLGGIVINNLQTDPIKSFLAMQIIDKNNESIKNYIESNNIKTLLK